MIDPILYYSMHACYSQLKTVLQYIMYSLNPQIREKFILSLDGETKKFSAAVKSLIELHRTIERFNTSDNQPELVQQLAAAVAKDSCKWVRTGWPLLITSKSYNTQYAYTHVARIEKEVSRRKQLISMQTIVFLLKIRQK